MLNEHRKPGNVIGVLMCYEHSAQILRSKSKLRKSRNGPAHGYPRIYKYIRFALRNEAAIA